MKKIINKLLRRFDCLRLLKYDRDNKEFTEGLHCGTITYHYVQLSEFFVVFMACPKISENRDIKVFYYTKENEDYARLCAEELCDKLNET